MTHRCIGKLIYSSVDTEAGARVVVDECDSIQWPKGELRIRDDESLKWITCRNDSVCVGKIGACGD